MWSSYENIARLSGGTCFTGPLGRRIRWWHSFLLLTKGQVKFRSKRQKFEIWNFLLKIYICRAVLVSRIPKTSFVLTYDSYKCKKCVSKLTASPLPAFWGIAQSKIKIMAYNFVQLLSVHSSMLYFPFLWISKNKFILLASIWKTKSFHLWGPKTKHLENPWKLFCKIFNLTSFGCYCLCFTSKSYILKILENWLFFYPKSRGMTSLKRHFLKTSTLISPKFCVEIASWCWINYRKFRVDICISFQIIEKVREGGGGLYAFVSANGGSTTLS